MNKGQLPARPVPVPSASRNWRAGAEAAVEQMLGEIERLAAAKQGAEAQAAALGERLQARALLVLFASYKRAG